MHVTNHNGGDRFIARRRELVDSVTQMMLTDEFYDGQPWVDLFEKEGSKGLLALICSRRIMRIFAAKNMSCAEKRC